MGIPGVCSKQSRLELKKLEDEIRNVLAQQHKGLLSEVEYEGKQSNVILTTQGESTMYRPKLVTMVGTFMNM